MSPTPKTKNGRRDREDGIVVAMQCIFGNKVHEEGVDKLRGQPAVIAVETISGVYYHYYNSLKL